MNFETVKNWWRRAELPAASRLSTTIAGCMTGIFFTADKVFKIPLKQFLNGSVPLATTSLISATVLLFKANKNLHATPEHDAGALEKTVTCMKKPSSHTRYLFEKLQITPALLDLNHPYSTRVYLLEIYQRLQTNKHTLEKLAWSSFWSAMQFVSHFAPEMLSSNFQDVSLYGFNSDEDFSTKNLFFGIIFLLALYNSQQTFKDEMNSYQPSAAELHFALQNTFTPTQHEGYGTFNADAARNVPFSIP